MTLKSWVTLDVVECLKLRVMRPLLHKQPGTFTFPLSNSSLHQVFASNTFNFCTDNHLLCTTSTATNLQRSHLQGTYTYRAPKLLKGARPTLQCDVYSLAITMWHLHTRKTPFQGKNAHAVIFSVVTFHNRPSFDDNFDTLEGTEAQEKMTFRQLVQECWQKMKNPIKIGLNEKNIKNSLDKKEEKT